jgi:lipoate-protein ligase A
MVVTSGLEGTRQQVYEKICQFLIQGWHSLGVELHYGNGGRGYIHNPNCFGTATQADLVDSNGNKLIGSAQLRQGKAILQHGSMLLNPDPDLFTQVFGEFAPHRVKLPIPISEDRLIPLVIESLTIAAQECFQVDLINPPLARGGRGGRLDATL